MTIKEIKNTINSILNESSEIDNLLFTAGGNMSKSSINKLNRYRDKQAKTYDERGLKTIKSFINVYYKTGIYDKQKLAKFTDRGELNLIKPPVDMVDYNVHSNSSDFMRFNLLKYFVKQHLPVTYSKKLNVATSKDKDLY